MAEWNSLYNIYRSPVSRVKLEILSCPSFKCSMIHIKINLLPQYNKMSLFYMFLVIWLLHSCLVNAMMRDVKWSERSNHLMLLFFRTLSIYANPVNFVFVWVPVTRDKVVKVQEPLHNRLIKQQQDVDYPCVKQ